jgi:hypothetical protein
VVGVGETGGGLLVKVIVPVEWRIRVWRDGEDYALEYEERVERPADMTEEEFAAAVELATGGLVNALRSVVPGVEVRKTVGGSSAEVSIRARAPLRVVAGAIASEFLALSDLGKMTLMELLALAGIGIYWLGARRRVEESMRRFYEVLEKVERGAGDVREGGGG